jgi:DNA-binding protein Fis
MATDGNISFERAVDNFLAQRRTGPGAKANLYQLALDEMEFPLLRRVMKDVGGNQLKAASLLGINRNTLRKKLKEHDLI